RTRRAEKQNQYKNGGDGIIDKIRTVTPSVTRDLNAIASDYRSALPLCLQRIFRKLKTAGSSRRG
ncbi:MAG: hypothetical protein QMB37_07185, partial [Paludibacteraceae bacterium]